MSHISDERPYSINLTALYITSQDDPTQQATLRVISLEPESCFFRTQVVWQVIYGIYFPELRNPVHQRANFNPCFFRPPEPGIGLSLDNEIFDKCRAVSTPLGITSLMINNVINSPGIQVILNLLGLIRFRRSDFVSLYSLIQTFINDDNGMREFFQIGSVKSGLGLSDTCDIRVADFVLRELAEDGRPEIPGPNSPACVREPLNLIEEGFFERFVLGVDSLASPTSAYSSIRTGIVILHTKSTHLNPYSPTPESDWPIEHGFDQRDHCRTMPAEGIKSSVYYCDGRYYPDARDYPFRTFIIEDVTVLSAQAIAYLANGVLESRFRIELPNLIYTYSIVPVEKYANPPFNNLVVGLLSDNGHTVSYINFFDTEVCTYTLTVSAPRVPSLVKYF